MFSWILTILHFIRRMVRRRHIVPVIILNAIVCYYYYSTHLPFIVPEVIIPEEDAAVEIVPTVLPPDVIQEPDFVEIERIEPDPVVLEESINYPVSIFRPLLFYVDFADISLGTVITDSSPTYEKGRIRYFLGYPIWYDVIYTAKSVLKKKQEIDKDKCWTMAGNEGFFALDFGVAANIRFVRYDHYELVDEDDAETIPRLLRIYALNDNSSKHLLAEMALSEKVLNRTVATIEAPWQFSRLLVHISSQTDKDKFTRVCRFHAYGQG